MHRLILTFLLVLPALQATAGPDGQPEPSEAVRSEIRKTDAGERILVQEAWLNAPRKAVWDAYVTAEGWTGWASAKAEIDLRVGGTLRTHYDPKAEIGDEGTNTLQILGYVPEELLTLRADLRPNWPEVMKLDADNLSNVILFEALGPERTHIVSYGIGYRDHPDYDNLLAFFSQANEGLLRNLIRFVETGERTAF